MFNESIKMAIEGMIANKMRTFLTLLGILIVDIIYGVIDPRIRVER